MFKYIRLKMTGKSFKEVIEGKKLNVFKFEYNSVKGKVKNKSKQQEEDFDTNLLRVSYATARTICSFHIDNKEFYFDIIASILNHLNFVEPNDNRQSFLLKKDRLSRLRDFSQKGRIGELGQGINYLFVQERLAFPFIIDYHLFCNKTKIEVKGRTPDFVLLNSDLNKIGLFESKSETSTKNKVIDKLNDAIEQLKIGGQRLLLSKKLYTKNIYPICTKFLFEHPEISTINYCDIAFSYDSDKFTPNDIIKAHYASWFYLVGDFTRAQLLSNGENISTLEEGGDVTYDGETDKDIYWVSNISNNQLFIKIGFLIFFEYGSADFKIGIRKDVVKRLTISIEGPMPTQEAIIDGGTQWFTDGTVLRINSKG